MQRTSRKAIAYLLKLASKVMSRFVEMGRWWKWWGLCLLALGTVLFFLGRIWTIDFLKVAGLGVGFAGAMLLNLWLMDRFKESSVRKYNPEIRRHPVDADFPVYQLEEIGSTIWSSMRRASSQIADANQPTVPDPPEVSVVTEAIKVVPLGTVRWRLDVYVSLFNASSHDIALHDIHAHVYYSRRMSIPPPGSIWEWRSRVWIELKEDNSILTGGKVYEVPSKKFHPFHLSVEISRLEEPNIGSAGLRPRYKDERVLSHEDGVESKGFMLTVFGLFFDYHTLRNGNPVKVRIPSDSIYSFQDIIGFYLDYYRRGDPSFRAEDGGFKLPEDARDFEHVNGGHALFVNNHNLGDYWKKHEKNLYGQMLVRIFEKSLTAHRSKPFFLLA